MQAPLRLPPVTLVCLCALVALPALAQSGAVKSGVRGRVVIAPELNQATTWPSSEEASKALQGSARIRRPSGRGPVAPLTEPMPPLVVALEGARPAQEQKPGTLVVEGMRFVPAQAVLGRAGPLLVKNQQKKPVTVILENGETRVTLAPGATEEVPLSQGTHTLALQELPFANAEVRVLPKALFLPVSSDGEIAPTVVEAGDYQLTFYHGARALRVQDLSIPDDRFVAIDAAVSANGVVTVSIKDGDLKVAVPPPPPPPEAAPVPEVAPAPKPRPKPKPPADDEDSLDDNE